MKNSSHRMLRVNELIKREIAEVIERREISSDCLISVTEVKTSADLRHAKVYISIFGGDTFQRESVMEYLEENRPEIQHIVASHIRLKHTPVIRFISDTRMEEADKILAIIEDLEKNEE